MAGNRAFVERCGFSSEEEMLGRRDHEIFPMEMTEKYQADDLDVIGYMPTSHHLGRRPRRLVLSYQESRAAR